MSAQSYCWGEICQLLVVCGKSCPASKMTQMSLSQMNCFRPFLLNMVIEFWPSLSYLCSCLIRSIPSQSLSPWLWCTDRFIISLLFIALCFLCTSLYKALQRASCILCFLCPQCAVLGEGGNFSPTSKSSASVWPEAEFRKNTFLQLWSCEAIFEQFS